MAISLFYGLPGKGKTMFATRYAFKLANDSKKNLVFNYLINLNVAYQYCYRQGYYWLLKNFIGKIHYVSLESTVDSLLELRNSVIVCDEGAIYFPARGSTHYSSKYLMSKLVQVRHNKQDLIVIAQSSCQIDKNFRELAHEVFHCNAVTVYRGGKQTLLSGSVRLFTPENYEIYDKSPKIRRNPLKCKILASKSWVGFLTISDSHVFQLYDSFNEVHDEEKTLISKNDGKYLFYSLSSYSHYYSCSGVRPPLKRMSGFQLYLYRCLPAHLNDFYYSYLLCLTSKKYNSTERAFVLLCLKYLICFLFGFCLRVSFLNFLLFCWLFVSSLGLILRLVKFHRLNLKRIVLILRMVKLKKPGKRNFRST